MSVITISGEYSSISFSAASPFMAVPQISTPKSAQFIMDLMPICTKGSSSTISSLIICKIPLKVRLTGMEA